MGEPAEVDETVDLVGRRDFSVDELLALAALLGQDEFPGVDASAAGEPREVALATARRALIARGSLIPDDEGDGEPIIATSEALMLTLAFAPALVVEATRASDDGAEVVRFGVQPELALEQTQTEDAIWTLELFAPEELVQRVVDFTALHERPAARGEAFTSSLETLERDVHARLGEPLWSCRVVATWLESEEELRTGQVAWVDADADGLWRIHEDFTVAPTSARELLDTLLEQLPGD